MFKVVILLHYNVSYDSNGILILYHSEFMVKCDCEAVSKYLSINQFKFILFIGVQK